MGEATDEQPGTRAGRRTGFLFPLLALLTLGLVVGLLWRTSNRLRETEGRLRAVEERAEAADRRAREYSEELQQMLEQARAARDDAARAEQRAAASEAALGEAEQRTEHLREEAEREAARLREEAEREAARLRGETAAAEAETQEARRHAREARTETQQAREELERIRERREQELDRMREALGKVALTRRTPSGMVVELTDDSFRFDFDSAELRPENRELLSRVAGVLLASEGYRLFIDGHTDDIGTERYNQDLSLRRARSVHDYLAKAGIPEEIMTVQGFGKSTPLVDAKTREARQKNRRVEIGIVDTIIDYREEVKPAAKEPSAGK